MVARHCPLQGAVASAQAQGGSGRRQVAAEIADSADTPEVAAMKDDKGAAIRRMVDALPEEHRTVIDLAYYHGRSVSEIGDILSIPVATVKTRMFYARKKLGEALKAAGYDRGWP